jgi:hypothetical protein
VAPVLATGEPHEAQARATNEYRKSPVGMVRAFCRKHCICSRCFWEDQGAERHTAGNATQHTRRRRRCDCAGTTIATLRPES